MKIHPELPIYRLAGPGGSALLYTPGTVAVVGDAQAAGLRRAWNGGPAAPDAVWPHEAGDWLEERARAAVAARNRWLAEDYRPECLTVYVSNRCNLRCVYCYAAPARAAAAGLPCLHPETFTAAAGVVARNCADKGRDFQFCCHGGGEPTLHWELVPQLARISKAAAGAWGVPWKGYIATNGVVPSGRAAEMAAVFGRVGLSCDGPPDIHDRQRPMVDGAPTSFQVRRTAGEVKEAGAFLEIRATITPETVSRQAEILEYLVTELGADSVTFEPVYGPVARDTIGAGGKSGAGADGKSGAGAGGKSGAGAGNTGGAGTGDKGGERPDPEEWAACFMQARQEAGRRNVVLNFSGFRPEEQHGPYCNTLRQSLHLTPDGRATNCFLVVDGEHPGHSGQIIGGRDRRSGLFVLDRARIALLRERAGRIEAACRDCFAAYHCARSCPDTCVLEEGGERPEATPDASFRCRLNRAVGQALLTEAALDLLREEAEQHADEARKASVAGAIAAILDDPPGPAGADAGQAVEENTGQNAEQNYAQKDEQKDGQDAGGEAGQAGRRETGQAGAGQYGLQGVRPEAAAEVRPEAAAEVRPEAWRDILPEIRREVLRTFEAAHPRYLPESRGLPRPLWETKGFCHDGEATWDRLRRIVSAQEPRPFSMYVHIPFCEKRCGFCDCYTVTAKPGHTLPAGYVRRLLLDLGQWAEQTELAARPVTTVHFGGGTPNALPPALFASVVEGIRAGFHTPQSTEWALESTARQLTGPHLDFLRDLGFRRLHVGVQTLEEPLRREIGRESSSETVLGRIADCLARGFVTTVDLLYGLPGQTAAGFLSGIERLDRLGVHGLSLYRFNQSRRNRGFLRRYRHSPDAVRDFAMMAAADALLGRAGYEKNHFCHYARPEDKNVYYTHARRGEDLLAVGASADGVFADLHYRSPELSRAFLDPSRSRPLFQGSVVNSEEYSPRATIAKHLMTGSVPENLFRGNELEEILERWRGCLLLREKKNAADLLELTAGGSWHLCTMLEELE